MTNSRSFACAGPVAYYFPEQISHICFITYWYVFATHYSPRAFSLFKHAHIYRCWPTTSSICTDFKIILPSFLSSSLWSQRMCSLSHMPKLHLVWTQFSTLSLSFSPEKSHLNPLHFLLSQSKLLFLSLKCAPFPGPRPPPSPFVSTITNLVY